MTLLLLSVLTLVVYGLGISNQLRTFRGQTVPQPLLTLGLGIIAATSHFAANYLQITSGRGLDFGIFKSASLITNIIVIITLLLIRSRPLHNLLLIVYPFAAVALMSALAFETPSHRIAPSELGTLLHACLSIVSYSVFSIAAIQAFLLYIQNSQLKAHVAGRLVKTLPPLQTMEALLFEIVWAGIILLTLSIISGALFIDNLFAQHLAHKTALSLIAWIIFAILLGGRHFYGWRGLTASRWALGGAIFLMLGYLGSKLVRELVLQR
jgi:ABC-type uncharacterized transport system permease subunit